MNNIFVAIRNSDLDRIIEILEANTEKVNLKDEYGETPLHHTCYKGKIEITKLLVHNGANINALDSNNDTPLHKACEFTGKSATIRDENKIECAKFLLQNGANKNLKNNDDRTPFDLCVSSLLQTELENFASNLEDTSFEPILKGGSNINYKLKYLKYKSKYFNLKNKF